MYIIIPLLFLGSTERKGIFPPLCKGQKGCAKRKEEVRPPSNVNFLPFPLLLLFFPLCENGK